MATVSPTPAGWPGTTGTLSGTTSVGCMLPVVLTSTDDSNGYGALDFDITPGQTFATLPIGSLMDGTGWTLLSGTTAESEPYLIVRFTDHTQAFVYSQEVNGPGTGTYYSDLAGNTYLTRDQALAAYGTKIVSSVTLAVDNGNLSIQVNGVIPDGCGISSAPLVNNAFACYSAGFEPDGGKTGTVYEVQSWLDSATDHYYAPWAILGNNPLLPQIGPYNLSCNPGAGYTATGQYLGDNPNGNPEIVPGAAVTPPRAGWYPIATK
ncbi:MAG: hypothetical protein ACREGG_03045 [Candidatus Saccharimonadales bacterium]